MSDFDDVAAEVSKLEDVIGGSSDRCVTHRWQVYLWVHSACPHFSTLVLSEQA
jgi:hypothetical protein